MNKLLSIAIAIVLIIAAFFIGYFMNKPIEKCPELSINQSEKTCFELEPWNNAVQIIYSGQVESLYTINSGLLSLRLKNGSWVHDVQMPTHIGIQDILIRCGDKCKDVVIATE